ncbi:MAG TPA: DUF1223 domain-containing protein [Xanthobacteraceae bacterium]|nr:DUF1223 domain-containing protein [Xanthobacteraceae bacterium]
MKRRRALLPALGAVAYLAIGALPARAEPRAVVELFTSQGCSSCPPADRLLGELARDPSLVAMSLPIDYWDYIGWKDTLSKPRHSARQRFYARARGDGQVFTPQVVVNGLTYAVGSDKAAIEQAIAQSRRDGATLSLPVKLSIADGKLNVDVLASAGESASGEVWLCALGSAVPVEIGRGENMGHTVTYHNVVRRWVKLGDWTGAARTFSVPASDFEAADAVAVIVQAGTADRPGTMLGAALASVR